MPQDLCIDNTPIGSPRSLALIAALLLALVAILAINSARPETPAQTQAQNQTVSPPQDDWHGNVKRSHWGR